jgi:glycosyltransferase involved in cell wall biosynthesis
VRVTLICTFYNEAAGVDPFFDGVASWTRLPDEIVLVDGGSTDGTVAAVKARMTDAPAAVRLIEEPGCNISQGRNIAVRNASHDLIASTDMGCVVEPQWLERMIEPFEAGEADLVSGYYEPICRTPFQRCYYWLTFNPHIDREHWLPSSRSIAFRKDVWEAVGGYPEHLTTAEDTLYVLRIRERGFREVFRSDARVQWEARDSLGSIYRQSLRYARGAGQGMVQPHIYGFYIANYVLFIAWLAAAAAWNPWFLLVLGLHGAAYSVYRIFRKPLVRRHLSPGNLLRFIGITGAFDLGCVFGFPLGVLDKLTGRAKAFAPPDDRGARYGQYWNRGQDE